MKKINKNLMALAIGAITLASTSIPSFAATVSNDKNFSVGNGGNCSVIITCNPKSEKCTADLSCSRISKLDEYRLTTTVWGGGEYNVSNKTDTDVKVKGIISGKTVKAPNGDATSATGSASVKADGKWSYQEVTVTVPKN